MAITHGVPGNRFLTIRNVVTCESGVSGCGVEAGTAGGDVVRVVEVVETQGAGHNLWWEQRQDLDEDQAGEQDGC